MARITTAIFFGLILSALLSTEVQASTINAASCSSSDVQTAISSAGSGDTVNVPAGTCTWTAQVSVPTAITLQGQTVCTGSGDPSVGSISCTDNTVINIGIAQGLHVQAPSGGVVTVTGFTFIAGYATYNGNIDLQGQHGQVGFRFHHNHVQMPTSSAVAVTAYDGYGLIDNNYFQDNVSSGAGAVPLNFGGDFTTRGYQNWNDPTNLGTNQAIYAEANYYTTSHQSTEGFFDAYYGAKMVVRYNTIVGNEMGGWHGTDSGQYRSPVLGEIYNNSISDSSGTTMGLMGIRGGMLLFYNNSIGGSNSWTSIALQYYRIAEQISAETSTWGIAAVGLDWTPVSATPTSVKSDLNTLNAPDFQAGHSYAAGAVVGPLSNNSGAFNFQNTSACTSGTYPSSWNQSVAGTTTDSGNCVWENVGGSTAAAPGGMGFCAANPDTACSSDSTCSLLSSGDTCSRHFDTNGGVYPFRDQPGRVHNQVLAPNYEWGNTGANLPSCVLATDNATTSVIVANRDYYNHVTDFNGTSGVGIGTSASLPSSCTPNAAYWATDTLTLYQCTATNTWTSYYTPYTYPHPLAQTGALAPPTNIKAVAH